MRNFHITRTAVSLCLTIALALQPVPLFASSSYRSCDTSFTAVGTLFCEGCRCCQIGEPGGQCRCCRPSGHSLQQQPVANACCGHNHRPAGTEGRAPRVATGGEKQPMLRQAPALDEVNPALRQACTCSLTSQPISYPAPRGPIHEGRDSVALGNVCVDGVSPNDPGGLESAATRSIPLINARFSQQVLCIWRL